MSGCLVPRDQGMLVTAISYATSKWAQLQVADRDDVLLRVSAGRFGDDRHLDLDDADLTEQVLADLDRILGVGAAPTEVQWNFGDVRFGKATYVHRAMNVGATPFHNLTIEILKSPSGSPELSRVKEPATRVPILENERVRVYRLSLAPGESTPTHTHPLPGLAVMITSGEIEITTAGKPTPDHLTVPVGDVRWRPTATTHAIKNIGKARFEAVDIEFK